MAFKKFRAAKEPADINLTPVMNLFVVLIPFLLLSAAFYHVGVIPTSLPSQSPGPGDDAEPNLKKVTVNLKIDEQEVSISASNGHLPPETLSEVAMTIPHMSDGKPDLETLGKALYSIKSLYPDSDTVVVLPANGVTYKTVVKVLDTAREPKQEATEEGGEDKSIPLFPVAVLSRMA